MREIPLTKGRVAIVDDDDYARISSHKWYVCETRGIALYAARKEKLTNGKRKMILMHREILDIDGEIDHINRNGLDNRRSNLREATRQMQTQNRMGKRASSSLYKGVSLTIFKSGNKRWKAQYRKDGKTVHIGYFGSEEEAARAYDAVARVIFEYGTLNFPNELD